MVKEVEKWPKIGDFFKVKNMDVDFGILDRSMNYYLHYFFTEIKKSTPPEFFHHFDILIVSIAIGEFNGVLISDEYLKATLKRVIEGMEALNRRDDVDVDYLSM